MKKLFVIAALSAATMFGTSHATNVILENVSAYGAVDVYLNGRLAYANLLPGGSSLGVGLPIDLDDDGSYNVNVVIVPTGAAPGAANLVNTNFSLLGDASKTYLLQLRTDGFGAPALELNDASVLTREFDPQ